MPENPLFWFPFFPDRWLGSFKIGQYSIAQEGMLIRLMAYQWINKKLPKNIEKLARLCRIEDAELWVELKDVVKDSFVDCPNDPESIYNKNLEVIRREQVKRHKDNMKRTQKATKGRWPNGLVTDSVTDP